MNQKVVWFVISTLNVKVTGSPVHWNYDSVSETVQDRDIVTTNH